MDNLFKVLGDENRLRIINLLRESNLCVCEMEAILGTSQSNVSRHLTRLRNENIVVFEKQSQWIFYQLNPDFLNENELLVSYLNEKMKESPIFLEDSKKLDYYKKSNLGCENIDKLNFDK